MPVDYNNQSKASTAVMVTIAILDLEGPGLDHHLQPSLGGGAGGVEGVDNGA